MSGSPQLYPEDQQEIFVAIPPPLVTPLARQLSSSHHGNFNAQQLATPITSTDNSFEQWTSFEPLLLQQQQLHQQQQRAMALLGGDCGSPGTGFAGGAAGSNGAGGQNSGLPPVPVRSGSRTTLDNTNVSNTNTTTTTNRAGARVGGGGVIPLSTPVSSPQQQPLPISLPVQLLSRLYPSSAMSTSIGDGIGVDSSVAESRSCASSSSAGSYPSRNCTSGFGSGSGVTIGGGFGSRSATSVMQQHQPDMMARRNSTELARTAAATAIVNTLVSRGNSGGGASGMGSREAVGLSIPRGDSPYIPSSLSMLFSDPEIMQFQTEVDQHLQQQQQQQQRRASSSQLTLSRSGSGDGSGIFAHSEGDDQESATEEHDDGLYGEESRLLQGSPSGYDGLHTTTTRAPAERAGGDGRYGYEIVQEDQQEDVFRPYAAMMAREDYLAPHEPSSSSPLFPSPLTTLGGFSPGTRMLDVTEDQQAQAAGRIWRDYGTMMENGGGGGGQFQRQPQLQNPAAAQSHAAYYHAVSNYHYSYNSNPHDDAGGGGGGSSSSASQVNPCVPTGHYAVPESWQWRRQRGRGATHQSYGSAGGNGGSGARRNNGDGSEDSWLWGILVSVVSCWVCCESPAACCSSCCL